MASSSFTSHKQPFPIVLANSFTSKDSSSQYVFPDQYVPLENPIYEFNVCECQLFLAFFCRIRVLTCLPAG